MAFFEGWKCFVVWSDKSVFLRETVCNHDSMIGELILRMFGYFLFTIFLLNAMSNSTPSTL